MVTIKMSSTEDALQDALHPQGEVDESRLPDADPDTQPFVDLQGMHAPDADRLDAPSD
jgi:hypothetical protein